MCKNKLERPIAQRKDGEVEVLENRSWVEELCSFLDTKLTFEELIEIMSRIYKQGSVDYFDRQ